MKSYLESEDIRPMNGPITAKVDNSSVASMSFE